MKNYVVNYWTGTSKQVIAESAWDAAIAAGYSEAYLNRYAEFDEDEGDICRVFSEDFDWCCTIEPV